MRSSPQRRFRVFAAVGDGSGLGSSFCASACSFFSAISCKARLAAARVLQAGLHHLRQALQGLDIAILKGVRSIRQQLEDANHFLLAKQRNHHYRLDVESNASLAVDPRIGFRIIAAQYLAACGRFHPVKPDFTWTSAPRVGAEGPALARQIISLCFDQRDRGTRTRQ